MLNGGELAYLKRALLANSAVLFTGAGFSLDATNANGERIPTGEEFADTLWKYLGYSGKRDGAPLNRLFEAALSKGHDPVRLLLRREFECKTAADWYSIPASFFWYRIYSTNIDDVLEWTYKKSGKIKLIPIDGQSQDYVDRDQFLDSIQYVKLNGASWENPKGITFSFRQYARRAIESSPWYEQCARDFANRPVVFVGTQLDESLLWNAIELRGRKFAGSEPRPKSFLVKPKISQVDVTNLKEFNVVPVEATAKEFFAYLLSETSEERSKAKVLAVAQPGFERLCGEVGCALNQKAIHDLQQFSGAFETVQIPDKLAQTRKSFLLGASPDWHAIHCSLDAARDCNADTTKLIEDLSKGHKDLCVVVVTGAAGAGKSTMLRRVAVNLRSNGHLVFWSDGENSVRGHVFENALSQFGSRPVVIVDNAGSIKGVILDYLKYGSRLKLPPIVVISDRANRMVYFEGQLRKDFAVSSFAMPQLSRRDIDSLLDKLQEHGMLGKLTGMGRGEQVREFAVRAGKQLLVAMREATCGADFDAIIENELSALEAEELKVIYLAVCIASSTGYGLTTEQLIGLTDLSPAECMALLGGGLMGVVTELGSKGMWFARHRIIAEVIVEKVAPRALLKLAYIRLLESLSRDLPRPLRFKDRVFRLYKDVINHQAVNRRFISSVTDAREIYDSVRPYCEYDHHFWLQYASLELEFGEIEFAEVYLGSAESIAPHDNLVRNTKASLLYRKASKTDRRQEAFALRDDARKILTELIKEHPEDHYPAHILCSHELTFVRTWFQKREELRIHMEALRSEVDACIGRYRYAERLASLQRQIHDAYLELAIR